MSNFKTVFSIVNPYQKLILEKLVAIGFKLKILDQTDVIVAQKAGKNLFFIDDYTPLIPHSVGMILTNVSLANFLLQTHGINVGIPKDELSKRLIIFIDTDGFLNVLADDVYGIKDVTSEIHPSLEKLAKKVLSCFPGLCQISFGIFIKNSHQDITKIYCLEKIYPSTGQHYQYLAISGKRRIKVLDLIIQNILKYYDL